MGLTAFLTIIYEQSLKLIGNDGMNNENICRIKIESHQPVSAISHELASLLITKLLRS